MRFIITGRNIVVTDALREAVEEEEERIAVDQLGLREAEHLDGNAEGFGRIFQGAEPGGG